MRKKYFVSLICPICNNNFLKLKGHAIEALKFGHTSTCSKHCQSISKSKKIGCACKTCNKPFNKKRQNVRIK